MERRALPLILASPLTWLALLIILGAEAAFYVWFQPPRLMFGVLCGVGGAIALQNRRVRAGKTLENLR